MTASTLWCTRAAIRLENELGQAEAARLVDLLIRIPAPNASVQQTLYRLKKELAKNEGATA